MADQTTLELIVSTVKNACDRMENLSEKIDSNVNRITKKYDDYITTHGATHTDISNRLGNIEGEIKNKGYCPVHMTTQDRLTVLETKDNTKSLLGNKTVTLLALIISGVSAVAFIIGLILRVKL